MDLIDFTAAHEFARKVILGIQRNIETKAPTDFGPMDNTGTIKNSLDYRIEGDRLIVFSDLPGTKFNYIMTLETGRKPGKMPPVSNILTWIKQRGIQPEGISQKSLAFLIARRIGREGSLLYRQGGNSGIISDFTNEKYIEDNFINQLADEIGKSIIEELTAA